LLELKIKDLNKTFASQVLAISRSSFYQPESQLKTKDELLKEQILSVLNINPSYGHRRIALALGIGKKRARRVMRKYGLKPYKRKRAWRKRRDLKRPSAVFANLVKGQCPLVPNYAWVSDFTYIRYQQGYIYLATFMDLFTREIVGWHIANRHTRELVLTALLDGIKANRFKLPKIIHSDQGSEYNCQDYINSLKLLKVNISMSKKGSPWENGYQESFYSNFKTDLGLEFDRFKDLGELVEAIHQTINYYNRHRIHTTLKMSPVQFRQLYYLKNVESVSMKRGT
jgi:putative transposase